MDYEQLHNLSIELGKKLIKENPELREWVESKLPELRESEDKRTQKAIIETINCLARGDTQFISEETRQRYITYLKKQEHKEQKTWSEEDEMIRKELIRLLSKMTDADDIIENYTPIPLRDFIAYLEKQGQKPTSTEDMPYVADEHFYEREPADTFKYKLAEYMTKNCRKEEGPEGYSYAISAETILKMAEEELLKRGVVQKPTDLPAGFYVTLPNGEKYYAKEMRCNNMKVRVVIPQPPAWSEENERILKGIIGKIDHDQTYGVSKNDMLSFLNHIRSSLKLNK